MYSQSLCHVVFSHYDSDIHARTLPERFPEISIFLLGWNLTMEQIEVFNGSIRSNLDSSL